MIERIYYRVKLNTDQIIYSQYKDLEAKLNENIVKDPSKTYLVWKGDKFPNSSNATFKAPAGCTIDWGDGNVETFSTASTTVNTHTYTDGFEYHLISLSNYTVVDNSAFYNCSGLTSVTIGNSVTSIGDNAFRDCSGLTSIIIPDSVTSIGDNAFFGCSGLTSVTIPDSVTGIGYQAFYNCSSLTSVTISDSVTTISFATFSGCIGLTSVTIGNSVRNIGGSAFENCSGLTSVTIPDSVTSIGNYAFFGCSKLKIIKISAINPPTLGSDAFAETPIEKIIVPKSSIDAYKSAAGWSTYADKIVYEVDSSDLTAQFGALNIQNGTGTGSLEQKYIINGTDYSAQATGENAIALGGKRYDKLTDTKRTPTSAEGKQSFAQGASSHAYGNFAVAMTKDNKSYQGASFTAGGGNQTGRTEGEFNAFYWDSVNNVGLHGGSKDSNGNILDSYGDTYAESYSFGGTFGEVNINLGRDSIVGGTRNKIDAMHSIVAGDRNKSVTGAKHIVAGFNNTVTDVNNTVNGDSNTVAGPNNIVSGFNNNVNGSSNVTSGNKNILEGDFNFIEGQGNLAAAINSTILGYKNAIGYTRDDDLSNTQKTAQEVRDEFVAGAGNTASHGHGGLIGIGLKTGKDEQVVVGVANVGKSNTVFEVGNGSYTQDNSGVIHITSRKNAFAVLQDGRAKVQSAPTESNDVVRKLELDTKYDKAGGTVTGDMVVGGNLTVQGKTTTVDSETLRVADKLIEVGKGNTAPLTSPAGLITPKYDGTNNGGIVYDHTGTAYVGDISLDSNGNVDVNNSDLQPIATRNATITNGNLVKWDGTNHKLIDAGKNVESFVDKLPASLRNQAYVRNADGNDTGLAYAYTDDGNTLALRNASGQLQVSDPSQDKDAANKSYADNLNARYVSTSILGG